MTASYKSFLFLSSWHDFKNFCLFSRIVCSALSFVDFLGVCVGTVNTKWFCSYYLLKK